MPNYFTHLICTPRKKGATQRLVLVATSLNSQASKHNNSKKRNTSSTTHGYMQNMRVSDCFFVISVSSGGAPSSKSVRTHVNLPSGVRTRNNAGVNLRPPRGRRRCWFCRVTTKQNDHGVLSRGFFWKEKKRGAERTSHSYTRDQQRCAGYYSARVVHSFTVYIK